MRLYEWQKECLDLWVKNDCRGIINVVTGAGKTMLALAAIRRLEQSPGGLSLKTKIIVPKTFLVYQWFYALNDILGVSRKDIGQYMGTHKSEVDRKYMIYVINSARYSFARHMMEEAQNPVLIIADECHHYGTAENSKIFDFANEAPDMKYYALGLSATPYGMNYERVLEPYLGREIFRLTFIQALKADIISRFSVINIGINFTNYERFEYDDLSDKIGIMLFKLKSQCPDLYVSNSRRFFIELDKIIKGHDDPEIRQLAETVRFLSYRRKELVHLAQSRIQCAVDLVLRIDRHLKILIFGERIETANEIYMILKELFPGEVGIYHSELHNNIRKNVLQNFNDSEIRILVSCKTLDEGLNVADTDVGIVVSSTGVERQRIQRLGRVLRKKDVGRSACFYYLYVCDTMEETDAYRDINDGISGNIDIFDLIYSERARNFNNSLYEELTDIAINEAKKKSWDEEQTAEFLRNAGIGIITCDWLANENDCKDKIMHAQTKSEKNYYIAMLMLIRARKSWTP